MLGWQFSAPTHFEHEFSALVKDVDDMFIDTDVDQLCEEDDYDKDGSYQSKSENMDIELCEGKCREDPLETWVVQPFIRQYVFREFASAASTPLILSLQDCIHRPTMSFTFRVMKGELVPVQFPVRSEILE